MPDSDAFAKEFIELLNRTKFPSHVSPRDMIQQAHALNYALVTRLLGHFGTMLTVADIASQGKTGGGPPHRGLDILLHYLSSADAETMENSRKLAQGLAPL
jgi:hypothetical protein